MREIAGKRAVVTGGGSGIGRGIALALADAGADVVVADIEKDSAEAVAREVAARGVRSLAVRVDVTDAASLEALVEAAGPLEILSNNAGVVCLRRIAEATEADWQWVMSVNFHGIVRSVAAFLPRLRARAGERHIVNTASMAGLVAGAHPGLALYTASKHAVVGYSETLRAELAGEGIGVSVLCPGLVKSNLANTSARNRPERFGGPLPEIGDVPELPGTIPAERCGQIAVRGIRENRAVIVTHPATRTQVEARLARWLADFDAEARAQAAEGA